MLPARTKKDSIHYKSRNIFMGNWKAEVESFKSSDIPMAVFCSYLTRKRIHIQRFFVCLFLEISFGIQWLLSLACLVWETELEVAHEAVGSQY